MNPTFRERKAQRTEYFNLFIKHWVLETCTACNGSGYYDHNDNPPCAACDGTGKSWTKPPYDRARTTVDYLIGKTLSKEITPDTTMYVTIKNRRTIVYWYHTKNSDQSPSRIRRRLHCGYHGFDAGTLEQIIDWSFTDLDGNEFLLHTFQ